MAPGTDDSTSRAILFVGAFFGAVAQAAIRDGTSMKKRARAKLVATESAMNSPSTEQATTIIDESGGDTIQTPKPGG